MTTTYESIGGRFDRYTVVQSSERIESDTKLVATAR